MNDLLKVLIVKVLCLEVAVGRDGTGRCCYDNVVGTQEVFIDLIEEGLTRALDADGEGHLGVDQLLFKGSLDDPVVSLPELFVLGKSACLR